jgi:hypothetical protein
MVKKKTVKSSKSKSSRKLKDLSVKRAKAVKGGMYRRSDPCSGEVVK